MKMAHLHWYGKILGNRYVSDVFLIIGKDTKGLGLYCTFRTSEYPQPGEIFLALRKDQYFENMLSWVLFNGEWARGCDEPRLP